jgi:hypothetical protein
MRLCVAPSLLARRWHRTPQASADRRRQTLTPSFRPDPNPRGCTGSRPDQPQRRQKCRSPPNDDITVFGFTFLEFFDLDQSVIYACALPNFHPQGRGRLPSGMQRPSYSMIVVPWSRMNLWSGGHNRTKRPSAAGKSSRPRQPKTWCRWRWPPEGDQPGKKNKRDSCRPFYLQGLQR